MKTMFENWKEGNMPDVSDFTNLMFHAYEAASDGNKERLQQAFPLEFLPEWQQIELTRINNDTYGNPRYVVHYSSLLTEKDDSLHYNSRYSVALNRAKRIGGRKFHNKQYGGGIVFQSYNTDELKKDIIACRDNATL